jgi:hypothetical protein
MIGLPEFKKLMGEEAIGLTDQEIEEIRNAQYKMAELAFEFWRKDKALKNNNSMLVCK